MFAGPVAWGIIVSDVDGIGPALIVTPCFLAHGAGGQQLLEKVAPGFAESKRKKSTRSEVAEHAFALGLTTFGRLHAGSVVAPLRIEAPCYPDKGVKHYRWTTPEQAPRDEGAYWRSVSVGERIAAMEELRRRMYPGYDELPKRMARVFRLATVERR